MMDRDNLLDLIRTFTIYSTNSKGEMIKVVARYQQFRAVKLAVMRLLNGKNPRERSGIIWHTQGSGKSLTMMFMVREMYRHPSLSKWKVVFITDRTQLEQQLAETSQSIGFTVKPADSIKVLKDLLRSDASDLVMAMIHKFREADLTETFPELNNSPFILVMTDEAHRSQYSRLAANLDKGIPLATRIGYTGTPIDKTERVFGDYIDKYTMRQAIADGVTLEIVYEGRTHNAEVPDQAGMDAKFADVFSDYNLQQRMEILGYGSRTAYLEADTTIEAKAKDMVQHYLTHVFPQWLQGADRGHLSRGGRPLQEARGCGGRGGNQGLGKVESDEARLGHTADTQERCCDFRQPQRRTAFDSLHKLIQARVYDQELQTFLRQKG